ncbi:MAG: peptidylprolyl isomerase [Paludibacteraceae bacterium]|nr:peptidylprolyl isomerase [Paludibacteraceae bacterium]
MKKLFSILFIISSFMTANAQKGNMVVISTDLGTIKVKLYDETPQHRDNFIKLAKEGFYNDLLFHRVIKDFMIQGGDPQSKGAPAGKQLGAGDVGYTIPAEFVYPKYYHKKGALAAARTSDQVNPEKRSSGCQFYIVKGKVYNDAELDRMEKQMTVKAQQKRFNEIAKERDAEVKKLVSANDRNGLNALQNEIIAQIEKEFKGKEIKMPEQMRKDYKTVGGTPFLDDDYTVFGEVVEGLDVVDAISKVATSVGDRPVKDLKMKVTVE